MVSRFKRNDWPVPAKKNHSKNGNGKLNRNGKLNLRHEKFIDFYLISLNATQAAIKAGYSEKTASSKGSQLLSLVKVQQAIQKRQLELQDKLQIEQEGILKRLLQLADYDVNDFFDDNDCMKPLSQISKDMRYAIQGLEIEVKTRTFDVEGEEDRTGILETRIKKFKLSDKLGALIAIGKHLGMFAKDNEQSKPLPQQTQINIQVNLVD